MNEPMQDNGTRSRTWLIVGAAIGLLYGLAVRLLPHVLADRESSLIMTVGFTCFMPFAMGCIAVYFAEIKQRQRIVTWLLLPWVALAGALAATLLLLLEGLICIIMFLPLGMVLSSLGGLLGGAVARSLRSRRGGTVSLACVMALPFFMAPWEGRVLQNSELREVNNVIDIQAPPAVVWRNIESVPSIRRDELPTSWAHAIGFPDPIEATLSHEGVGGVRRATFAGGVLFLETVDVWEPEHRLAFSIAAQTNQIPATTLDEHVRVGGPYFDVLRGEYRIEPLANGTTRLHLSSRHRLSTDFNWYAHLWTDAVMADLQKRILRVIQHRCEATQRATGGPPN